MSDSTAQEAMIPYPNEINLMGRFMALAKRHVSRLRGKFDAVRTGVRKAADKVKTPVREAHLFAKGGKEKNKLGRKIHGAVKAVQAELSSMLAEGHKLSSKAGRELTALIEVGGKLLPQINYFLKTGWVAKNKIIQWSVSERMRKRITRERARVEGSIGTLKSSRYGFNRPRARSTAAMERCGHRAILGFNLRKLVREWATETESAAPA